MGTDGERMEERGAEARTVEGVADVGLTEGLIEEVTLGEDSVVVTSTGLFALGRMWSTWAMVCFNGVNFAQEECLMGLGSFDFWLRGIF